MALVAAGRSAVSSGTMAKALRAGEIRLSVTESNGSSAVKNPHWLLLRHDMNHIGFLQERPIHVRMRLRKLSPLALRNSPWREPAEMLDLNLFCP